ncbi:MAG: proline dehydrogenase family protein [Thaumarchaeota archaeon]|nr:proline dehydrogenase family protein [Nitrososphaerota archaeon]
MPSQDEPSRTEKLFKKFAKQWMAGDTLDDAVLRAKESNKNGINGIINLIGELATSEETTKPTVQEYFEILQAIDKNKVSACITVKPTQMGASIDEKLCRENFARLLDEAKKLNIFVWIDMESSKFTQLTLDLYRSLSKAYDNVGVALQAYLKRSAKDLDGLLSIEGKVRLCKGAYRESSDIIVGSKEFIDQNFFNLMKVLFEKGNNFAIATHDNKLIEKAKELSKDYNRNFEFQMLLGIRENLKFKLVAEGFRVSNYIPYGRKWLAYTMRRLRERRRNILLIFRSLFGG